MNAVRIPSRLMAMVLVVFALAAAILLAVSPKAHAGPVQEASFRQHCATMKPACGLASDRVKLDAGYRWCGVYGANRRSADPWRRANAWGLATSDPQVYNAAGKDYARADTIGRAAHGPNSLCPTF